MRGTASKPRVLVIDDDPSNRMVFRALLDGDYDLTLVESGPAAWAAAAGEDFAVILLDACPRGMDGYEAATRLRAHERTRHTPIVFTSSVEHAPVQILRDLSGGATDFLFTPLDPDYLKFKIAAYARLYARGRVFQAQIERLNGVLASLREELAGKGDPASPLQEQVRRMERTIEELRRHAGSGNG